MSLRPTRLRLRPLVVLCVVASCTSAEGHALAEHGGADFDLPAYERSLEAIDEQRRALASELGRAADRQAKADVRRRARSVLLAALDGTIFPAWMGTPWSMGRNSTAIRPHEQDKTVGCSYFVTGALMNAGLVFDSRSRFAQAPALHIQRSLAPARAQMHRYLSIPAAEMASKVEELGDGLYLIGLRNHIGFIRVKDGVAMFVHSGPTGVGGVQKELLGEAPSVVASRPSGYFVSNLIVPGDARGDGLVDAWLTGKPVRFQAK